MRTSLRFAGNRQVHAALGQGGRAVLLKNFAAVEMTVEVEVVVDRSMNGSELLQGLHVSEICHRPFLSPERLV